MEDCYELGLFVRDYRKKTTNAKPILAVGMGALGQLSRVTSPISLVTHPLIPFPSAPGQISLAQVHQARHLLGRLPREKFWVVRGGQPDAAATVAVVEEVAANALRAAFAELGYPHVVCEEVVVQSAGATAAPSTTPSDLTFEVLASTRSELVLSAAEQFTVWTGRPAPLLVLEDKIPRRSA